MNESFSRDEGHMEEVDRGKAKGQSLSQIVHEQYLIGQTL